MTLKFEVGPRPQHFTNKQLKDNNMYRIIKGYGEGFIILYKSFNAGGGKNLDVCLYLSDKYTMLEYDFLSSFDGCVFEKLNKGESVTITQE